MFKIIIQMHGAHQISGKRYAYIIPIYKNRMSDFYASHCKELGLLGSVALPFFKCLKFTYYLIIG